MLTSPSPRRTRARETPPILGRDLIGITFMTSCSRWASCNKSPSDKNLSNSFSIQRVFGIMRDKNPDMVAGEKKKFVMRPPQVSFVSFSISGIEMI